MSDDMKLRATVVDQATGPIRDIGRAVRDVARSSSIAPLQREFSGLHSGLAAVGREIRTVTVPALASLGLTGGGAIASAVGLARALSSLAEKQLDLRYLSREIGFASREIKAFSYVAEKMRIAPDAAQQGLKTFAHNIEDIKLNIEGVRETLIQHGAADVVGALQKSRTNYEALAVVVERMQAISRKNPAAGRRFAEALFGDPAFARMTLAEITAALGKFEDQTEAEAKAAKQFNDNMVDLQQTLKKLQRTVGNELMPTFTEFVKEMTAFFSQEGIGKALTGEIKDLVGLLREAAGIMADLANGEWKKLGGRVLKQITPAPFDPDYRGPKYPPPPWAWSSPLGDLGVENGVKSSQARELEKRLREKESQYAGTEQQARAWENSGRGDLPLSLRDRRKALADEIQQLKDQLRILREEVEKTNSAAKKTSLYGGGAVPAGGGFGGLVVPASFGSGGGYGGSGGVMRGLGGLPGMPGAPSVPGGGNGAGSDSAGVGGNPLAGVPGIKSGGGAGITAPAGTPVQRNGMVTVESPSGKKFQVAPQYAENFRGFLKDYEAAGGVIGPNSGTLGHRSNPSGHPIGTAIDINQVARNARRGGVSLPRDVEDAIAKKWGFVNGAGWRNPDAGHFGVESPNAARNALIRNGIAQPTAPTPSAGGGAGAGAIEGAASTYNPYKPGWRSGGPQTASGEGYDPDSWTAAIQTGLRGRFGGVGYGKNYKPAYAMVEHNGKKVVVRVNDVGPLTPGRIIDLNERAMRHFDPTMRRGVLPGVKVTPLPGTNWKPGPYEDGAAAAGPTAFPRGSTPDDGRERMDKALSRMSGLSGSVTGSASIDVTVKAPKGTAVGTGADGIFKKITVNRSTQMPPAAEGPADDGGR